MADVEETVADDEFDSEMREQIRRSAEIPDTEHNLDRAPEPPESFEWEEEFPDVPDEAKSRIKGYVKPQTYSAMEKLSAAFSSFNSIAQLSDIKDEWRARKHGANGVQREQLLKDVPQYFHEEILNAAEEYNDDTALVVRNNLMEDLEDNKVFDSMPWYAQIGYGAPAALLDPMAVIPGVGVGKAAVQSVRAVRTWQTVGAFKNLAIGSTWLAAGATETAIQAAPKLAADYTYNSSDYVLDTIAGGLLGAGLGLGFEHRGLVTQFFPNKVADKARIDELAKQADVFDVEMSQLDDLSPAQRWEVAKENAAGVDLVAEGQFPLSIEGKLKIAALEKDAKTSYGRILQGEKLADVDPETQAAAKAAFRQVEEARRDPANFVFPEKPDETLRSPRDVEVERRLAIQKLKEDYAESLNQTNEQLQTELHGHIISQEGVEAAPAKGSYTSKEVTGDTSDFATLATEIHHGQPVLVEVDNKATLKVVPEETPNISKDLEGDITRTLDAFAASGEEEIEKLARKSSTLLQEGVRGVNWVLRMKPLSTILAQSPSRALRFVAARLVESPQGFGGKYTRKKTATLHKDSNFREAQSELVVAYRDATTEFEKELGGGAVRQSRARQESGTDNPNVEKFNREFIKLQELRRQGEPVDHISKAVRDFSEGWNKSMDISFNNLIKSRVAGFSKQRKIDNYYTQSWLPDKMHREIKRHGQAKVRDVLAFGYRTAAGASEDITEEQSREMAESLMAFIERKKSREAMADDEFVSTAAQDARSKARLSINTIAEIDGLSVMDLLDTNVIGVGERYNHRAAGWSALSDATDGLLNSDKATVAFLNRAKAEGASKTELRYYNDVIEMILGKPVRGGLSPAVREFKDLAALTQLGGKGMAALAEVGQAITRPLLKVFNNKDNLRKIMRDAGSKGTVEDLSTEAQRLSRLTDDMEWLERQSTHTDTAESIGNVKYVIHTLASKATGGNRLKANASRGLGKISGFNMFRKAQTRIVHAGLMREISDNLTKGKSVISNDRLIDLGILNKDGKNPLLAQVIRKYGTFEADGTISKMNFEKWPKKQQDEVRYALIREDAQMQQRAMVGELPGWMNSPVMSVIMQYKEMPMVAMNKSLGRAAGFADREAVVGVILSTMTAAMAMSGRKLVMAGSDTAIADEELRTADLNTVDTLKYVNYAGIFPDLYDLVLNDGFAAQQAGTSEAAAEFTARQVPVLSLFKAYKDTVQSDNAEQLIENAQSLTPLGNTMLGEAITTSILETM